MVPLLIILDPTQGCVRIKGWFWQYAGQQKPNLVNGQSGSLLLKTDTQSNQEMMSQRNQQHMMMPTQPAAHFVVVETNLAFSFFENGFNWPTHAADAHEFDQGSIGGGTLK